jgi:hypothetical protein
LAEEVFAGFSRSDFSAFKEEKQEDPRFNNERKVIWNKMKTLHADLDTELKRRGFTLKGHPPSRYWIYTRNKVNGIWIAYTETEPYYMGCQLNCGIYERAVFCGIEINRKALDDLQRVMEFISSNTEEFLDIVRKLDTRYFHIGYNDWGLDRRKISASDVNNLLVALGRESGWFDLGELYPKSQSIVASHELVPKIAEIFELLFPLYLVFVGRRPLGQKRTAHLLRIGDSRESEAIRKEKELAPEIAKLNQKEIDELINTIDKRNKAESGYRDTRQAKAYRRNPVLSSMLKQKYKDTCQMCGMTMKIDQGYFCDTHHLKPLKNGGLDISENIVVVCPNHHRVLDRSQIEVISRDPLKIMVKASKQVFEIKR